MSEWTLHTGGQDDRELIHISWFNGNMARRQDNLEIIIQRQDHPRVLEIRLNDVKIAEINAG